MPTPLTNTPDALDAATAASLQSRREKLLRRVRNQRIRMRIALGLSGCIAVFAFTAYLIGDYTAAKFCALIALISFVFNSVSGMAARKAVLEALQRFDQLP